MLFRLVDKRSEERLGGRIFEVVELLFTMRCPVMFPDDAQTLLNLPHRLTPDIFGLLSDYCRNLSASVLKGRIDLVRFALGDSLLSNVFMLSEEMREGEPFDVIKHFPLKRVVGLIHDVVLLHDGMEDLTEILSILKSLTTCLDGRDVRMLGVSLSGVNPRVSVFIKELHHRVCLCEGDIQRSSDERMDGLVMTMLSSEVEISGAEPLLFFTPPESLIIGLHSVGVESASVNILDLNYQEGDEPMMVTYDVPLEDYNPFCYCGLTSCRGYHRSS
jgi:hypothetical protein